jgi:hypothetical protein
MRTNHARALALVLGITLLASCAADSPSAPSSERAELALTPAPGKFRVCHRPAGKGSILEIGPDGLADHLAHGDYITTLMVGHDPMQPTDAAHFATITGALSAARASRTAAGEAVAAACRISIIVSAGTYQGTVGSATGDLEHFPMIVDVPDITLHGALVMALDAGGRATGEAATPGTSVLAPDAPLPFTNSISIPILIATSHPGGSAGNGLVVEGFVFQSGHGAQDGLGGQGILGLRALGLAISGNRFEGGFTEKVDLRATSADVTNNYFTGPAATCDLCLAGPGTFTASGNRILAGGIPGIAVSPTVQLPVPSVVELSVLPGSAETWATVRNNDVRGHQRVPVGVGIRLDAIGVGAPDVHGTIHAVVQDNTVADNRFGMIVHAAFPVAGTALRGDVDMTLGGNVFQGSCETDLLVSFARHSTGMGIDLNPRPYQRNSTFQLALNGNLDWGDAWVAHPEGFGNTLIVDGAVIPNGTRQFYDATGCPGSGL